MTSAAPEERLPAADCHAHVYGASYANSPDTLYVPEPSQAGTAAQFRAVLHAHGLTHGLLVGAGVYGHDNSCLLDAIAASEGRMKGIALVPASASQAELQALAAGGVVGIRLNLMNHGMAPLQELGASDLLQRVKDLGWFAQVQVTHDQLVEATPILMKSGVRLVIDHMGRPDLARGIQQPGFQALLALGRAGNAAIKLSAPFRTSKEGYPYCDVDPYVEALVDAFTLDNCVWGSDWPFVRMDQRIDYGLALPCLERWFPDSAQRRRVLWTNPSRLFGFSSKSAAA